MMGSSDWWTAGSISSAPQYYPVPQQPYVTSPQPYPVPQVTTGTDLNFHINTGRSACMSFGHQTTEAEWSEDEVVSYCAQCGEKFRIAKMPGGSVVMRIKFLLELLMLTSENIPPGVEISMVKDPLVEIGILTEDLEMDFSALEEAQKLLDIAKAIIRKRVGHGSSLSSSKSSSID